MTRRLCAIVVVALILAATGTSPMRAEEPSQRVVRLGFVGPLSPATISRYNSTFWERLPELGWVEGQNLVVEARSADGHLERLPALIAEVIDRKVDVLVTYGEPAAIAAKKATSTVPIVVAVMPDPVRSGLVASLARPGGNLTGLSGGEPAISGKMLELLQEAVPTLSTVAVIANPNNPMARNTAKDLEALAPARGLKLHVIELRGPEGLGSRLRAGATKGSGGRGNRRAHHHRAPGTSDGACRQASAPRHLPGPRVRKCGWAHDVRARLLSCGGAQRSTSTRYCEAPSPPTCRSSSRRSYLLTVNLKTARALGLTIPESILVRADEVIR